MRPKQLRPARRKQIPLRVGFLAESGNGKTYTMLATALHLAQALGLPASAIGVIDTETVDMGEDAQGSSEKYEGVACGCEQCGKHGIRFEGWQTILLPPGEQNSDDYIGAIDACRAAGIQILCIDSMTHEWEQILAMKDQMGGNNKWTAWGQVMPYHDRFMKAWQTYPGHVLATIRGKEKHTQEGKTIVKLGVLPIQKPGIEHEFDVMLFVQDEGRHSRVVKTRADELQGRSFDRPGLRLASDLLTWSRRGEPLQAKPEANGKVEQPASGIPPAVQAAAAAAIDATLDGASRVQEALQSDEPQRSAPPRGRGFARPQSR